MPFFRSPIALLTGLLACGPALEPSAGGTRPAGDERTPIQSSVPIPPCDELCEHCVSVSECRVVSRTRSVPSTDGLLLLLRGALSLDRASSIARSNAAVASASMLNRGDHAVLRVAFAGQAPLYRVEVDGSVLAVTIGG